MILKFVNNGMLKKYLKSKLEIIREMLVYIVVGVVTTLINFMVFILCTRLFKLDMYFSNSIAWILAVLFAYFANKYIVFKKSGNIVLKELGLFVSSRIVFLMLESLILYLGVEILNYSDIIIKAIAAIIVVLGNYIISKKVIFHAKKNINHYTIL